jgi:hypothetical protein
MLQAKVRDGAETVDVWEGAHLIVLSFDDQPRTESELGNDLE